jgi:hypothetical protein
MTFIAIEVKPNLKKIWQSDWQSTEDGMMRDHDMGSYVMERLGTTITLSIMDSGSVVSKTKTEYYEVSKSIEELFYKYKNIGMEVPVMPKLISSMLMDVDRTKGLIHKHIKEELDASTTFFEIHSGMRGWYVISASESRSIDIIVDDRFPKYFSKHQKLSQPMLEVSEISFWAQELYLEFMGGEGLDDRYAIKKEQMPVESETFDLGQLSDFAPKQQKKGKR